MKNRFMRTILVLTAIMAIAVIPAFSGKNGKSK